MTSQSQTSIQSSTDFSSHPDDDSHPTKFLSMSEKTPLSKLSPSPLTTALLPPPVTDDSSSPTKRSKSKKNARVTTDLRLHWEKFRRRFAAASAPSTSSQIDDSTSESNTLSKSTQPNPTPLDDPDDLLDEVIVDREWSNDIKSSSNHSDHGPSPDKSGGSNHLPGTNTDHESFTLHLDGFWAKAPFLIYLRWRLWPAISSFFLQQFVDQKSEAHYTKENWFLRKVSSSSPFLLLSPHLSLEFGTMV